MLPTFRERDILIDLDGAPGTSEDSMRRITSRASSELRGIPGVRNVSAHMGRAIHSDKVTDVNAGEIWVGLDRTADYDATVAAVRETVSGYPGFDIDVQTYMNDQIEDQMRSDDDLTVRIYGEDFAKVQAKAEEVQQLLSRVDGIVDPEVNYPDVHPNLEIEVDLERSKEYGLKPGDVRRAAATLLSGIEVGSLFEEQKVFDVVVWGTPNIRHSMTNVEDLLIDAPGGGHVRLKQVADIRVASAPKVITREAVARHMDVGAGIDGRDATLVAAEIEDRIRREVDFPLEFRAEVLGQTVERAAVQQRLATFGLAAALGIFLLLQAAFRSWSLAFFFFLAMPVAVLGGLVVGFAGGGMTSLGAFLGLVAVFALAARNGLTLIHHYRNLEKEEGGSSAELVLRGTRERFVPIVMTAIVTALAVAPFAFMGNIAGHEILHPMSLVILGGLVSATLVNVLVVPSLYLAFGADAEPDVIAEEEPTRLIA